MVQVNTGFPPASPFGWSQIPGPTNKHQEPRDSRAQRTSVQWPHTNCRWSPWLRLKRSTAPAGRTESLHHRILGLIQATSRERDIQLATPHKTVTQNENGLISRDWKEFPKQESASWSLRPRR